MMRWTLRRLWALLGRRYPRLVLYALFQSAHLVALGGVALLALYVELDQGTLLRVVAVTQAFIVLENLASLWLVDRLLRPADPWLEGLRTRAAAERAWAALVSMPVDYIAFRHALPFLLNVVPMSLYLWWELDASLVALPVVTAGATVSVAYGLFLRFFGMEQILRPILQDVAGQIGGGASLRARALPLRARLLVALPIINVVTGFVVIGLSQGGGGSVEDLTPDVLIAVGVAFALSLELSLLLSRSIVDPIRDLRSATERVARGDLTARVPVLSTDEAGRLAGSFNEAVHGLGERERLREAFGVYVDPVLADRVLAEGTILAGEEVDASIVFVDIRDFTAYAERAGAGEVVERLNGFFALVVPVLTRHGGHANKFLGDGLLGVFGAPERHHDHADRAVAAALEVVALVRERFAGEVRIGLGVSSGAVVAGTVGGGGRLEFTVIGDPVNTAARVERATRDTGDDLLITEATRARLRHEHGPFSPRTDVALRGKAAPVRLWAPREEAMAPAARRPPGPDGLSTEPLDGDGAEPRGGALARAASWVRERASAERERSR